MGVLTTGNKQTTSFTTVEPNLDTADISEVTYRLRRVWFKPTEYSYVYLIRRFCLIFAVSKSDV